MKLLTVIIVCISMCCVNSYTIFPLPGQSAPVNPKFGRFELQPLNSAQSVTATKIIPFLSTLPPLPSTSYKTSRVPLAPTSFAPPSPKPFSVTSYQATEIPVAPTSLITPSSKPLSITSFKTPGVPAVPTSLIPPPPTPLSVTSYPTPKAPEVIAPTLATLNSYASTSESPKTTSSIKDVQKPSSAVTIVNLLATDLLPPLETSVIEPVTSKPIKPEIEAPATDLLPPKFS